MKELRLTTRQILDLKYKVENETLREYCLRYGVVDCMSKIRQCLKTGFGFIDGQRIDRNFMNTLSHGDRTIYNGVTAWIDSQN